jgi:outer membrane protein TolC
VTDLRPQLQAQQVRLQQEDAALQLQGAAVSADIALRRALGGGYDARINSATPQKISP